MDLTKEKAWVPTYIIKGFIILVNIDSLAWPLTFYLYVVNKRSETIPFNFASTYV